MARLVSYRARDENRYSTFDGETSYTSSENLTESNRIRLLPKKKAKMKNKKVKNTNKMAETMPTISATIELHRNKIAQSQTISATPNGRSSSSISSNSNAITQGRRRPLNRSHERQSRFNCCFNSVFCTRKCNWRWNQGCCTNCWHTIACCCWWKWCCQRKCCGARICCGCNANDDSENDDDDIDAKFEQYKLEMRLNDLKRDCCDTVNEEQETSLQLNSYRSDGLPPLPPPTMPTIHNQKTLNNENAISDSTTASTAASVANGKNASTKVTSKIFRYRKYWNWNDSLRSNSDKFLETLEYDMDGEQSLNRANNKHKRTDASGRTKGYIPDLHVFSLTFFCIVWFKTEPSTRHTNVLMWQQHFCFLFFSTFYYHSFSSIRTVSYHFVLLLLFCCCCCLVSLCKRRLYVIFLFRFPSSHHTSLRICCIWSNKMFFCLYFHF